MAAYAALAVSIVNIRLANAQETTRPTLAVLEFELQPAGRLLPPPQLAAAAATLLVDRLVASGLFHVYDGHWLQSATGDVSGRGRDRRAAPGVDAIRAGAESLGVDYLALGSVIRFTEEQRHRGFGGGGLPIPILGGFGRQQAELAVSIDLRVIDVRTGEVMTTAIGRGTSRRQSVALGGLGLAHAAFGGGLYSRGSTNARDSQLDEAVRLSVEGAAEAIVVAAPRLRARRVDQ